MPTGPVIAHAGRSNMNERAYTFIGGSTGPWRVQSMRAIDARAFDKLLARLRDTEEWKYVERETDVRLILDPS
jgi:hypothetical protein